MARSKNRYNPLQPDKTEEIAQSKNTWRTALYARLSIDRGDRKVESIDTQLELMRAYANKHSELTGIIEYTDSGYTGTNFHRPGFAQLMEDVRSGKINCIVVKDLSRLGRDYLETSNYVEVIFPFLGVRFISVNDHFDTDARQNGNKEMEIALKNLVNDMYARDISKRLCVTRKQEQVRGRFVGSNAPYGYKVNENHPLRQFVIDEPTANVVRQIYKMALAGKNMREISCQLQEENYSIPGHYLKTGHLYYQDGDKVSKWYIGTIANILHNQAYAGHLVQGKKKTCHYKGEVIHFTNQEEWIVCENAHQAIVSQEEFDRVQQILTAKNEESKFNRVGTVMIPVKPNKYKNLLYCGTCGAKLSYSSVKVDDHRNYYFLCDEKYNLQVARHYGIRISEPVLDGILKDMIGQLIRKFDNNGAKLIFIMKAQLKKRMTGNQKQIRSKERKIRDVENTSALAYEDYALGQLDQEVYLTRKRELDDKLAILQKELNKLQDDYKQFEENIMNKITWLQNLQAASEGELDENLLNLLIKKIQLYPKHKIQITWRFEAEDLLEWEKGRDS